MAEVPWSDRRVPAFGVSNNTTGYRGTDALVSSLSSKVQLHKPNVIDLILYSDETDRVRSHATRELPHSSGLPCD
jgi:hypothetical protein